MTLQKVLILSVGLEFLSEMTEYKTVSVGILIPRNLLLVPLLPSGSQVKEKEHTQKRRSGHTVTQHSIHGCLQFCFI
jgi:hypothetical protein